MLPVYKNLDLYSDLGKAAILKGGSVKNQITVTNGITNINKLFVGLPAFRLRGMDVSFLVYLNEQKIIAKNDFTPSPVCRLSYRALMYFQMRYIHFCFRDVQDSDESRDL